PGGYTNSHASTVSSRSGKPPRPSYCDAATRGRSTPTSNTSASSPAPSTSRSTSLSTSGAWSTPEEACAPSTHRATTTSTQLTQRSSPHGSQPVKSMTAAPLESADRSTHTSEMLL